MLNPIVESSMVSRITFVLGSDPKRPIPGNSEKTKKGDVEEGEDGSDDVLGKLQAGIYEDLDELANLLPYAADETWILC